MHNRTCRLAALSAVALCWSASPIQAQLVTLTEGFESGAAIIAAGWFIQNNSTPIGTNVNGWNQVQSSGFTAHAGSAASNMVANFNAVAGANTISAWLLTPQLDFSAETAMTFFTRTVTTPAFPDRLQVRLSTAGAATNVGTGPTGIGDFTALLLDINPNYTTAGYPNTYTQYTVNIPAQGSNGRLAFRYFTEDGGPLGNNSDIIGVDTFNFAPVPEPGLLTLACAAVGAAGYWRRRRAA